MPKEKKIFIFGSIMWDIVGKSSNDVRVGKDNEGVIFERPGGVAYNVALNLSRILKRKEYQINLISALGNTEKSQKVLEILKKYHIETTNILVSGNKDDKYLAIEDVNGEIFGAVNNCNNFLSSQSFLERKFQEICSQNKENYVDTIFVFDGNCPKAFLESVKRETIDKDFDMYFIPANSTKLSKYRKNAAFFTNFNLFLNLQEAQILSKSENVKNAVDACKTLFNERFEKTKLIIVTDGSNFACGITKNELAKVKPHKVVRKLSKSGAGDTFFSYFLSQYVSGPDNKLQDVLSESHNYTIKYLENE
ncbi:PfkB family carbohydrate kinase [Paracoccaceae bacterium]|nr:PfkB family carbohydrate kinase [Paracoccaceae bacterium]